MRRIAFTRAEATEIQNIAITGGEPYTVQVVDDDFGHRWVIEIDSDPSTSVYDYLLEAFDYAEEAKIKEPHCDDMPIGSNCGEACKQAIDAGALLYEQACNGYGKKSLQSEAVIRITREICEVFIYG